MAEFLLTGGSGCLGGELQKLLDCWAPTRKELNIVTTDIDKFVEYNNKRLEKIHSIIHAAAYTNVPAANTPDGRRESTETNIYGTRNIAELGKKIEKRVVYISTDYVYSEFGPGGHKETDKIAPFGWYGFTKAAGETYMDENKDLIIRTSFKPLDLWAAGRGYDKAFYDVYTSADYSDVVAKDIALVANSNLTGIINVGTEKKSIYDLAIKTNPDVKSISRWDIFNSKLPNDISMNLNKLKKFKKK